MLTYFNHKDMKEIKEKKIYNTFIFIYLCNFMNKLG